MNVWSCLETVPGLAAVAHGWRRLAGNQFEALRTALLEPMPIPAQSVPCPRDCGCAHEVILGSAPAIIGVCRCESQACDDLVLSGEDLVLWRVSLPKLGRRICRALDLESKPAELGLPGTVQAGAWSANYVPVIVTVQDNATAFQLVITTLGARLQAPFILFAPTGRHLRATDLDVLRRVGAGFFTLENTLALTAGGTLQAVRSAGELFASFTPEPRAELDEEVACSAFAIVQQLDSEQPLKPPSVLTVFRLFCMEALSAGKIARKFGCSKTTVLRRVGLIRKRTGREPAAFRAFSDHYGRIEARLSDHRARRINRRSLADERRTEDESEG